MQRSFATIHKIIDLLHGGLLILNEQGFHVFQYKLRQWINRKLNISQKPQIPNDEAQEIAFGGERVTHLYPNDLYYAHLSIYWFASKFVKDKIVLDAGCGDGPAHRPVRR